MNLDPYSPAPLCLDSVKAVTSIGGDTMPMSPQQKAQQEARRQQVLQLAMAGGSLRGIALQLSEQYGLEISHQQVKRDLDAILRTTAMQQALPRERYRALLNERYNRLLQSWWRQALGTPQQGETPAIAAEPMALDKVMKILEAQRRMNGVDEPQVHHIGGEEGGSPIKAEIAVKWVESEVPFLATSAAEDNSG